MQQLPDCHPVFFAVALSILAPSIAVSQDVTEIDRAAPSDVDRKRIDDADRPGLLSILIDGPVDFGGWMSGGFTANAHGNRTGTGNAPLPLNEVADAPVMNQLWAYAEKPLDLEHNTYDWGFRVDFVFGTDAPDSQAFGDRGWDFGWDTSRDYGFAIPQLYAELGRESLTIKVGYFFGLKGYEATQAADTFFYSHNYAFGYGVPGTHSGVLATYELNDNLTIDAGWVNGWDSWWSNYLNASTFLGGFTWTLSDDTYVAYHVTAGNFGDGTAKGGAASNEGRIYAHAIIFEHKFSPCWTYALENTLGSNTGIGANNSQWYSLTNYVLYEINDHWSAGARLEWFRDANGKRVNVNGSGSGSFYETTLGLNWKPHPNIRVRPEARWDWFDGQGLPFDSRNSGVNGTKSNQFTGALDVIIRF